MANLRARKPKSIGGTKIPFYLKLNKASSTTPFFKGILIFPN
jgi:hypothetical protein